MTSTVSWALSVRDDSGDRVSVNDAYTVHRGRKLLTAKGRAFKERLKRLIVQRGDPVLWNQLYELVYQEGAGVHIHILLGMPDLISKSWEPGTFTKKGAPRSMYRRKDATNYVKLIEDAIAEASGVDDANFVRTTVEKVQAEVAWTEIGISVPQ